MKKIIILTLFISLINYSMAQEEKNVREVLRNYEKVSTCYIEGEIIQREIVATDFFIKGSVLSDTTQTVCKFKLWFKRVDLIRLDWIVYNYKSGEEWSLYTENKKFYLYYLGSKKLTYDYQNLDEAIERSKRSSLGLSTMFQDLFSGALNERNDRQKYIINVNEETGLIDCLISIFSLPASAWDGAKDRYHTTTSTIKFYQNDV